MPVEKCVLELLEAVTGEVGDDEGPVDRRILLDLLQDGR